MPGLLLPISSLPDPLVFTEEADYSKTLLTGAGSSWTINHVAPGSDLFRYTGDYGITWSDWKPYEDKTEMNGDVFVNKFWDAQHLMVQYFSNISGSAAPVVHADSSDYKGGERRFPKILARGDFNNVRRRFFCLLPLPCNSKLTRVF